MFHFYPKNITRSTITCGIARGPSNAVHVIILDGEPARDHSARQQTKRASKLLQYSKPFTEISTNAYWLLFKAHWGQSRGMTKTNEFFLVNESFSPVLLTHSYAVRTCLQRYSNMTIFLIFVMGITNTNDLSVYHWTQRKGLQHKLYRISPRVINLVKLTSI